MKTLLPLAVAFSGSLALAVACSSSDEAAPTRTITPAPTAGTDAGGPPVETPDASTCFSGDPASLPDFLNACTDGQCAPFDNVARLPLYQAGKPLPAIP